nr:MAG TPA: Mitochondrial FAD-linked sulfhydryl oxidase ERV1-helix bundle, Flavin-linked sulfhydryl oxidase [Caudoviricetes sp.]
MPPVTPCVPCRLHFHNSFFYCKSKYTNRRNELRTVDLRIKLKGDR